MLHEQPLLCDSLRSPPYTNLSIVSCSSLRSSPSSYRCHSESELTMEPKPTDKEVGFILEEANNYLKLDKSVASRDVKAAWSGIRPLVLDSSKGGDTKAISRSHVIEVSKSNMVTIAGGKWTTYRR